MSAQTRTADGTSPPASGGDDLPIVGLLVELGVPPQHRATVRRSLETAGLTTPRKTRIARHKTAAVTQHLQENFVVLCSACSTSSTDGHHVLLTRPEDCHGCRGSNDARAVTGMARALNRFALHRLVVVGGSPSLRRHLRDLVGTTIEIRLVDGTTGHRGRDATANVAWADVIAIMGGSQLSHRVSGLYTGDVSARHKTVTVPRRGLTALASSVTQHARRRATAI